MSSQIRKVEEASYGIYVWNVEGRGVLVNEAGDPLRINSMKGDLSKMANIRQVAASLGYPNGEPVFVSGKRAISEGEYQTQLERQAEGQLADPYDIPALVDKMRREKSA